MLTKEGCAARRRRLFERLPAGVDWALVFDPQHLVYFANYYQTPFQFRSANASAALVLGRDGTAALVCDNLLQEFADEAHVDEIIAPTWYRGRESAPPRRSLVVQATLERIESRQGAAYAVETGHCPAGVVAGLKNLGAIAPFTPIDAIVHELKRTKDPDELAVIRRSLAASDAAFDAALAETRPGMTEFEVFLLVQERAERVAGEAVIVYGDFVSGPRTEQVGGAPSQRVIEPGDLVLVDFSVVVRGYRGDCANTFACGGAPTADQRRLSDACLAAIEAGEGLLRAGVAARDVDRAVRASFATQGLAENFRSHSGHGLGLGHPDPPYIVPESTDTLVAGDVVTLEPGQYVAGVGGMRYERNYLITQTGYERLSHLTLSIDQPR